MERPTNKYSLIDYLALAINVVRSKLINRNVRLIRFPVDIRGRRFIDFGKALTTGRRCRFDVFSSENGNKRLHFGSNVQLNDSVHFVCMDSIVVGDNVLIASHVFVSDCSHGSYKGDERDSSPMVPPTEREYPTSPIVIERNVWIGEGVVVMPGVTIGEGSVIGAHTIVNKDVPKYSIAVGTPMKVIKKFDFETNRWKRV